jgi:glycosyltransferase involved in cell wall biosynthesis
MVPEEFSILERIMARLIEFPPLRLADLVTFESPIIREKVASWFRIPREKTMILYNGVDTNEFDPELYLDSLDTSTIVWAARICDQKNHLTIVEALPRIVSRHSDAKILFIGGIDDERYFRKVKQRISELGMEKHVVFNGPISYQELKTIYARTAIHLVFSRYTGFDVALGENLASGRAIVVSDIPTVRDLAPDLEYCLFVHPNDPEGLADAISELIENGTLRAKLSLNARKLAEEKLDWSMLAMSLVERMSG